jgi:hypothetical protein
VKVLIQRKYLLRNSTGLSLNAPPKDYSVQGTSLDITFAAFNSVSMMMTAYANPLVVEIQVCGS